MLHPSCVNYSSKSASRAASAYLGQAPVPVRVSTGRNRSTEKTTRAAADRRPERLSRSGSASAGWEPVQEIFRASRTRFTGLAYSIVRNQEDAEDAVQDAMLSALRHLRKFEGRSAFTTWFTRIVFNAALMIRRKRKSARIESFANSGENDEAPWIERIPTPQLDSEKACAEAETFLSIDERLRKMSPLLRQAFTMAYYDELSFEEAGVVLGVTTGTFKSRVFRAKQYLIRNTRRSLVAPIAARRTRGFLPAGIRLRPRPQIPLKSRSEELPSDDE
jgi:RNA polymerase sigma-70 factor (ECF subfamily)